MPQGKKPILLHQTVPPISVDADGVYFAFASGRLSYDCVTCNAGCCRGHGYGINVGHELDRHLLARPGLRFFLGGKHPSKPTAKHLYVSNCPPACFFLTEKGRCQVHENYGYDAKPETCRLFPFNYFRRAKEYLVVAPHPTLCPLEVLSSDAFSARSDHLALLEEMRTHGIGAAVSPCLTPAGDLRKSIRLEQEIVRLSEQFLRVGSYRDFAAAQLRVTRDYESSMGDDGTDPREVMNDFLDTMSEILAVPPQSLQSDVADVIQTVVAATPFLRSELLFPVSHAQGTQRTSLLDPPQAPFVLLGIHALATFAYTAGMAQVTFQTVTKLFHDFKALLLLLSYSDSVMVWRPYTMMDLSHIEHRDFRTRYLSIVKSLLPKRQYGSGVALGTILRDHSPSDDIERVQFLKLLAQRLVGRITPLDSEAFSHAQFSLKLRAYAQRWAVATMPEDIIGAASERLASRYPKGPSTNS